MVHVIHRIILHLHRRRGQWDALWPCVATLCSERWEATCGYECVWPRVAACARTGPQWSSHRVATRGCA